jgi:hypothetical protein
MEYREFYQHGDMKNVSLDRNNDRRKGTLVMIAEIPAIQK